MTIVPKTIDRLNAVAVDATNAKLKVLPAKLDAAACLDVLAAIGAPHQVSAATGTPMDIKDIDAALSGTELSLDDRVRLKAALRANGWISAGRKMPSIFARGV